MRRIMIAGTHSGCGKTTVTCAILQALVDRGMRVASFKCGPDYIDPMFHQKVIGTDSHNLDGYFCDGKMLRLLVADNSAGADISVVEGVMGFYDGVAGKASSHAVSREIDCPVVMVIDCKGMSTSIGAVISGFLNFRKPNNIVGFVFNRLPEQLAEDVEILCKELSTEFLGYIPFCKDISLESRKLGLTTPDGISDLKNKTRLLASKAEQTVDIERMLDLAERDQLSDVAEISFAHVKRVRIAVARDAAFSFIYNDNISLLERLGAEIKYFSPLDDNKIPDDCSGLILCGGYPELFVKRLSDNREMIASIRGKIEDGMPVIAECGGFMYLHEALVSDDGTEYPLVGIIHGKTFSTPRLQRFGYVRLRAKIDNLLCKKGENIPAHEFHYWDSENCGGDFEAVKESNGRKWDCIHATETMYAGYPHLYFYADIPAAVKFIEACSKYGVGYDI